MPRSEDKGCTGGVKMETEEVGVFEFNEILSPGRSVLGIRKNGTKFGQVPFHFNRLHLAHVYLEFEGNSFLNIVDTELIQGISSFFQKPLQVMVSSREASVAGMLRALGFERRRRCYEVVAGRGDYLGIESGGDAKVQYAGKGSEPFQLCSDLMLRRYIETHRAISPWTGSSDDFFDYLPAKASYEKRGRHIENLAFIVEGEIAYVCGREPGSFKNFAETLIVEMFEEVDELFFEADDNDIYAMTLRSLFAVQNEDSWDTYVFPYEGI